MAKKKQSQIRQKMTAAGQVDDWIDATEVALSFGTFEKIKLNRKGDTMSAQYGADDISVTISQKDAQQVRLEINCTNQEVLKWYKACVADVICNPDHYADYYAGTPKGDANDRTLAQNEKNDWIHSIFQKKWLMIVLMIVFPPAGLVLFLLYHRSGVMKTLLITLLLIIYTLFIWLGFLGIDTGFGLSGIKSWFGGVKNKTEMEIKNISPTPEPTPTIEMEYVGE